MGKRKSKKILEEMPLEEDISLEEKGTFEEKIDEWTMLPPKEIKVPPSFFKNRVITPPKKIIIPPPRED